MAIDPIEAERQFKIDFHEFYGLLERGLVCLLGVWGIVISASAGSSVPTASTNIIGDSLSFHGSAHRFHANVISALEHPSNPLYSTLGSGPVLAYVGIAFAICFCIGPPIGAYFASRPLPSSFRASGFELNVYAMPAFITLVLLVLETIFLVVALPETRGKRAQAPAEKAQANGISNGTHTNGTSTATNGHTNGHANGHANGNGVTKATANGKANGNGVVSNGNGKANGHHHEAQCTVQQRISTLSVLRRLHFLFLGLFSGMEFTLTFLTFDRKSPAQLACHAV